LLETFVKTNTALMVTPMNYMTSGCTCVAVYMKGRTLYVANSGDSRAVMACDSGKLEKFNLYQSFILAIAIFTPLISDVFIHFED
jgi:serine/threonine protein phosphatase PrpC